MIEPSSPLHFRDFRLLWLGRFCSTLATSGIVVIIGYQLYDVARGQYGMSIPQASFQLGILGLVQFLPLMLLTPLAGLLADRFDRRKVAALSIGIDMIMALSLALVTHQGGITLPILFALAALHGAARVFVSPALSAILPNVVPAALMPRAIAMSSLSWQVGAVLGPAVAGLLFSRMASLPYWSALVLLAISCLCTLAIRKLPFIAGSRDTHPLKQIREGIAFVRHDRFLLGCITLDLFAVLLGGATALLPVYARDILHVGSQGLGIMRAAPSIGAGVIGLFLSWRPITQNVGSKMLWSVAIYGAATVAFGLCTSFALSLVLLSALGAADMVSVFIRSSLVQLNTPDAMRGRVSSISGLAISASNELGEMQSGLFATLFKSAPKAVVFGGVAAIIITAGWAWLFPELRNARTFAAHYRTNKQIPKEHAP
ncbi:MAG: MFS transporter [Novosphingobium sp.]